MKTTKEIIKRAEKGFNLFNKTHISFWKLYGATSTLTRGLTNVV